MLSLHTDPCIAPFVNRTHRYLRYDREKLQGVLGKTYRLPKANVGHATERKDVINDQVALGDMPLPMPWLLRLRDLEKNKDEQARNEQRKFMGLPGSIGTSAPSFVIVLVGIGFAELALQAAGYTIVFAVSVELVHAVATRPRWKRDCDKHLADCLASSLAGLWGNVRGSSRCVMCYDRCDENGWPAGIQIDDDHYATCTYK